MLKKQKKAQGLSLNVIIIAAIALLVLVVLSIVFMGRMGIFNLNSDNCLKLGGSCDQGRHCDPGYQQHPSAVCYDSNNEVDKYNVCCIPITKKD